MEITREQFIKHLLIEIVGLILVAIGAAGIMKVALGTGAYDALALSISSVTAIEVGTVGLITNCICIVLQIVMLRKKYRLMFLLQIPVSFLMGMTINYFYYTVFAGMNSDSYIIRMILLFVFIIICSFGDAMMIASGMIGLPVESTCMIFAKNLKMEFGKVRQLADVVFIILIFICWFFFHAIFPMREGTIILALTFGPLLGYFTKKLQPRIHKWVYETTN